MRIIYIHMYFCCLSFILIGKKKEKSGIISNTANISITIESLRIQLNTICKVRKANNFEVSFSFWFFFEIFFPALFFFCSNNDEIKKKEEKPTSIQLDDLQRHTIGREKISESLQMMIAQREEHAIRLSALKSNIQIIQLLLQNKDDPNAHSTSDHPKVDPSLSFDQYGHTELNSSVKELLHLVKQQTQMSNKLKKVHLKRNSCHEAFRVTLKQMREEICRRCNCIIKRQHPIEDLVAKEKPTHSEEYMKAGKDMDVDKKKWLSECSMNEALNGRGVINDKKKSDNENIDIKMIRKLH
ncbi:hypothetical protein RFI_12715 [Reticulomyxa filosa]|uniref:Uncharacterized protein n=1 Tax=Reticulomyxa filosa TaxID=46433 RepID=X6NGG8_RETFI|nr:hypothetical protein RFI_12715 [Reticulomyxa filosa]|eukprot:ETO24437.1 hypothetical protein RFI_12715 [Reticulomyxa filosa]